MAARTKLQWVTRSQYGGTVDCPDLAIRATCEMINGEAMLCSWAYHYGPHALREQNPGDLNHATARLICAEFLVRWDAQEGSHA